MNKILPLKRDLTVGARCWDFYRLSAILNISDNFSWFIDKFMNYYMRSDFILEHYNYYSIENMYLYDEVIKVTPIYQTENIINTIVDTINNNSYILSLLFDKNSENHSNDVRIWDIHDCLIYGYNYEKRELCFISGIDNNDRVISFSDFQNSYDLCKDIMNSSHNFYSEYEYFLYKLFLIHNMPLSSFNVNDAKPNINVERLYFNIDSFLNGSIILNKTKKFKGEKNYHEFYGISVYKGYYLYLLEAIKEDINILTKSNLVIYGIKKISKDRQTLKLKLNYLEYHGVIGNANLWIVEINKITHNLDLVYNLLMKMKIKNLFDKLYIVKDLMMECEILDYKIFSRLKIELDKSLNTF